MHPYPHRYVVSSSAQAEGDVVLTSPSVPDLHTAPPPEFDGPGGYWSPETLLAGAVVNCFVLSFRAVARASKLEWTSLSTNVEAVLERADGVTRFTHFTTKAVLTVPEGADINRSQRLLLKAEKVCLVSNSLNAERHLEAEVVTTAAG